jgi:hypothetical protein
VQRLAHRDGVDLERPEAGTVRGGDALEHPREAVAAREAREVLAVERVERHVHP